MELLPPLLCLLLKRCTCTCIFLKILKIILKRGLNQLASNLVECIDCTCMHALHLLGVLHALNFIYIICASFKRIVTCTSGGAKSKETRYSTMYVKVRFGRILQLTVLNLQMKKPICKRRTVIVVGSYQTSLYHTCTVPCFIAFCTTNRISHQSLSRFRSF